MVRCIQASTFRVNLRLQHLDLLLQCRYLIHRIHRQNKTHHPKYEANYSHILDSSFCVLMCLITRSPCREIEIGQPTGLHVKTAAGHNVADDLSRCLGDEHVEKALLPECILDKFVALAAPDPHGR